MNDCTTDPFRFMKLRTFFFSSLALAYWAGTLQPSFAETAPSQPIVSRAESKSLPEKGSPTSSQFAKLKPRKFVREWKVKDLRRALHQLGEGRSYSKGKKLFMAAACVKCHKINKTGGSIGPDLTGVAGRNSRVVILQEIIEPSKKIPKEFQPQLLVTSAGKSFAGLVIRQDTKSIFLSNDPENPDQLFEIPREDIEEQMLSEISIMPKGLLNTLKKEEILDLLAYVEAGGQEDHPAFDPVD